MGSAVLRSGTAGDSLFDFKPLSQLDSARELVAAIQRLSLARSLADVQEIVRTAARRLTGADGATFILRDEGRCYYADEDAISPLWRGQRFPMEACISGWAMLNRESVTIEDIYADERIPHEAYRPTFVKSLAMVPIRTLDPVGAIGNYWATRHQPSAREVELLQALADSTAVAMENVRVYEELEDRVAARTAELQERIQHHLEVLHTLAHEVRTPLAAAQGIIRLGPADGRVESDLSDVDEAISEVLEIVNGQLENARLEAGVVRLDPRRVDAAAELAPLATLRALAGERTELVVERPSVPIWLRTDPALLGHVLRNLVGNALKFTDQGEVRVRAREEAAPPGVSFVVSDTGIGIGPDDLGRIFEDWGQVDRAQSRRPPGSGLGLPLVRRLVGALGGRIAVESELGQGSTFTVWLPTEPPEPAAR